MANIGLFKPTKTGWEGFITTLTLCTTAQIVPNRKKRGESSPDYFIKAGDSDLGAAWKAMSQGEEPKEYLRCVLDDPSFVAPVQAALFERKGGADLVWKRI
ncbi:DUF736 domain-containing protein [Hyphomonas sp.]|uniref:DUF736 domain-containing protein n=1 Tax=Hyphomonas sp. TaxID=87 RepID=UPI003F72F58D